MSRPSLIVAPSILAADFARLADEARAVESVADWLHVDVMDNHFVPNLTIGLPVVRSLRKATGLPFDVHLMITDPARWAPGYAEAGAYNVTFHAEACDDPVGLAADLRAAGARAGLAIDRDTPVEPYLELLPHFDTLLIMTIKAGFGGQSFIPEMLDKVRQVRRRVDAGELHVRLEIDGGVAADTIEQAAEAGADAFVAGTAVYGADDPAGAVRRLRAMAESAAARAGGMATGPEVGAGTGSAGPQRVTANPEGGAGTGQTGQEGVTGNPEGGTGAGPAGGFGRTAG